MQLGEHHRAGLSWFQISKGATDLTDLGQMTGGLHSYTRLRQTSGRSTLKQSVASLPLKRGLRR
ncbi:hypothetical protein GQ44DRAFT_720605 [Phaeosphaeriaceae sp. PMI808]|nr:hypothetical protein GQ44DRAFT_720605 [Phaeosphaeriaceae sp. PMI808]